MKKAWVNTREGAAKVILTAPGKGAIKNIVSGVNSSDVTRATVFCRCQLHHQCYCRAQAMNDEYEIVNGHMETVHAANDQNLIDDITISSSRSWRL